MQRIRGVWAFALAAVVGLGVAACGEETEPPPTGEGTLRFVNASGEPIVSAFYDLCVVPVWGPDKLADGEVIADGAEKSFTVDAGCWDVRVDFVDNAGPADRGPELLGVDLDDGETFTWTIDPEDIP